VRARENGTYLYAIIIKGKDNSIPQASEANGRGAFCLHILRMSACTCVVPFALIFRLVAGMCATCSFGADCVAFMQAKNKILQKIFWENEKFSKISLIYLNFRSQKG